MNHWPTELEAIETPLQILKEFSDALSNTTYPLYGEVACGESSASLIAKHDRSDCQQNVILITFHRSHSWPCRVINCAGNGDRVASNPAQFREILSEHTHSHMVVSQLSELCE